jgi:hypothetical protein
MLMTVTQESAGTYDVQTQPLTGTPSNVSGNKILGGLTPSGSLAPLDASFKISTGTGASGTGTISGPYYVTASGGHITADITVVVSNYNSATGSGTVAPSGTLSGGSGGIALTSATIGSDSTFTLENIYGLVSVVSVPLGVVGTLDLSNVTTSAYSYAAKFTIGAGAADKSGTYDVPGTISLAGSVAQIGAGGAQTPLFSGDVSVSLQGISSFDATQPISSTNFVTAEVQVAGLFSLTGGRVLSVMASINGSQTTPTPAAPDSLTATYTYSTPSGTAQVNATAQYDSVNGYSGTLTNNGGVKVTVTDPINGSLSGTVTDNGTKTATITAAGTAGPTINYSDGTVQSLF